MTDASESNRFSGVAADARDPHVLVRAAWRFLVALRAVECALVGASAAVLTLAAGIYSGSATDALALRIASTIAAVLAALSWWLEHEPDLDSTERRIDRREQFGGELVTAFEVGRKHASRAAREHRAVDADIANEIERALGERVASRLTLARCLRAIAPASAVLLAAPLAGAAVLFAAIDHAHYVQSCSADAADGATLGVDGALGSLAAGAQSLRTAAASAETEDARALTALAEDVEHVRASVATRALSPAAASSELDGAIDRVRALSERSDASSKSVRDEPSATTELDRARRALESARAELARNASDARSRTDRARVAEPSRNDGERSAPSIIARPDVVPPDPSEPTERSSGASAAEERGASGGRWWPERYDAIVERWVEMQRASSPPSPSKNGGR
jgi:hypothetical protein